MKIAGERIPSEMRTVLRYEHLHRYAMCGDLVNGKDVLDVAAGEGYGSAMLARTARTVLGVEAARDTVRSARRRFYRPNLRFLEADCTALPLADAAVDVAVCFDTLERHGRHDAMMAEIRRVLRPAGVLVIGSPNPESRTDAAERADPFVEQLYFDDFAALLERYFAHVSFHGQRLAAASFVYHLVPDSRGAVTPYVGNVERVERDLTSLKSPAYFIAVCTAERAGTAGIQSLFIDADDDLLQMLEHERDELAERCNELLRRKGEEAALSADGSVHMLPSTREHEPAALGGSVYYPPVGVTMPAGRRPQRERPDVRERDALQADLDGLRRVNAGVVWALADASARVRSLQREIEMRSGEQTADAARLAEERDRSRMQVAVLETQIRFQAARLAECGEELETAERRLASQSQALARMQHDETALRAALSSLTGDLEGWRARAAAASAQAAAREETVAALTAAGSVAEHELAAASARVGDLESALDDARRQIASVTASRAWKLAHWARRWRDGRQT